MLLTRAKHPLRSGFQEAGDDGALQRRPLRAVRRKHFVRSAFGERMVSPGSEIHGGPGQPGEEKTYPILE
jgi:hypothetical protein